MGGGGGGVGEGPDLKFTQLLGDTIVAIFTNVGVIAGNIRSIALLTIITVLIPENRRDKADGLVGAAAGIAFELHWMPIPAMVMRVASGLRLFALPIPEQRIVRTDGKPATLDIRGTPAVVAAVPGSIALICFTTLEDLLADVYTCLLDPYGLSLASVQAWAISCVFAIQREGLA